MEGSNEALGEAGGQRVFALGLTFGTPRSGPTVKT
jgi:hypothetical protein